MVIRQYLIVFKSGCYIVFCINSLGERDHLQDANEIQLQNVSVPAEEYTPLWYMHRHFVQCTQWGGGRQAFITQ